MADDTNTLRLIHAALVADGAGNMHAPGSLLVRGRQVVGVGSPNDVGQPAEAVPTVLPDSAVIPALVNAHTHLDLTACGCWPFEGEFESWLGRVLEFRNGCTPESVDASVQQGVRALERGGVAAVGDIAGPWATQAGLAHLARAGLGGTVFTEVFGNGTRRGAVLREVQELAAGRQPGQGLQPHAPYSSHREVFQAALQTGMPLSTHLAESPEELEFLSAGTGRFRRFLERLGAWDGHVIGARHPVEWLAAVLEGTPDACALCAHCNYVDDAALQALARSSITVAYCPRSSDYFGHRNHRYRDMLQLGIPVALGTDSIICLDTPDRISTLDEMRYLMRRDGLPLNDALTMATVNGAHALGLDSQAFTLTPGTAPKAGILSVRLMAEQTFAESSAVPEWVVGPCVTWGRAISGPRQAAT